MIKTNYWNNYYIKSLNSDENNLLLYLATNDFANYSGIIKISNKIISADLGLSLELVNNILAKFTNDNICYFDSETNYLIFNKCEFFSFRENLNIKTEMKLKSIFNDLPERLKEIICVKFADLKPYFSEKKTLELTKNIILNLVEFKSIINKNDGVSVNNLIMIKKQVEILINDILEQQNEFSPLYNSYILNNLKECTQNKLTKKDTPLNKKTAPKTEEKKTKRGRPKKETKIYADHFIIRDGKQVKVGRIEVENCDIDGKELFKPKNKYFKSVVKPEDVNYDMVKNMFYAYTEGWSKEGKIEMSNVIEKYYSKRKSQNWVMNRTLEQDIQKWYESQFSLKPYRNMAEKTQIIENIEIKFNQTEKIEAKNEFSGLGNGINSNRVWADSSNSRNSNSVAIHNGNMDDVYKLAEAEQRKENIEKPTVSAATKMVAIGGYANRPTETPTERQLTAEEIFFAERMFAILKNRENNDSAVQGLLQNMKSRGEHIHNYFVQRGYFYIE
jgi:hypothetical protein